MGHSDCIDCDYAEWVMTKHNPPRINKNYCGKCKYPLTIKQVKSCLPASYLYSWPSIYDTLLKRVESKDYWQTIVADTPMKCAFKKEKANKD